IVCDLSRPPLLRSLRLGVPVERLGLFPFELHALSFSWTTTQSIPFRFESSDERVFSAGYNLLMQKLAFDSVL
ncbi:hypothetical protein, partial [Photobacterium sp. 1_MG-2023]|uniref:hypothetical protein n=1 Tax=Photobacterium sp. 1_MG-2023 TaxID=3062646 RepID=UPI0026E38FBD